MDLRTLRSFTSHTLEEIFRGGRIESLTELGVHPHGSVLAIVGLDRGLLAKAAQSVHTGRHFVWEGKSFLRADAREGRGANRVRALGRRLAFPYRTYLTDSVVDGQRCLAIDYDLPENPSFVRATYDEVRRVGNGMYLGRGMVRRARSTPLLLLWFALDATQQDAPLP